MTIKHKHINANGDVELTMHWQDVLFLPIGGRHGKTDH